ncbi:SCP-like extracellular [Tolypothrix sp. NIES-4075]|uniref:CAP domain-containing protein n=1 Tax=Tolypothrix sp. NIES-4075 TaxID=2005459 RepID=UPI000B5CB4FF|nr:CAP domain-containing protein [Tolypothrix sp. NIES-4075]GAX42881.1 SCP-like extracellular [Tolypothrix sp. NIES-4075]
MSVEIYTDSNFSGAASGSLDQDYSYVGDFWNDKISSIKVYSGTWEFFEDANFQGKSFRLTPGEYPWVTNTWNDMISSFKKVGQDNPSGPSGGGMAQEILNAHNSYRSQVGVPPLTWSNTLASQAQEWANYLSSNRKFEHSGTSGQGENLWMGTSHRFSFTQMVGSWGNEKQHFVKGTFPNVSNTGNWADVGHYTQMVWRNTTQVGCAVVDGGDGNARLVCRYVSPGNVIGQSVF